MTDKPRLWISRPTFDDVVERLSLYFDVETENTDHGFDKQALKAHLSEVDAAIVGMKEYIGTDEIAHAERLRFIANLSVGYDNLDIPALTAAGIGASNTAGTLDDSVADFTWALMLAAARRLGEGERFVRAGKWQKPAAFLEWMGLDIHGRTLGILGMGRIGQAIARRAVGFRMPVIYHNRSRLDAATEQVCQARYVDKKTLVEQADVVVVVVPRTPETMHIIGEPELAAMKSSALLINVARGGVIDETALVSALREKQIAAAGLDVFDGEPAVNPELMALDNVVLSPHIASATVGTRHAMTNAAADNVLAYFGFLDKTEIPPNLLNPDVLKSTSKNRSELFKCKAPRKK